MVKLSFRHWKINSIQAGISKGDKPQLEVEETLQWCSESRQLQGQAEQEPVLPHTVAVVPKRL